MRIAFTSKNLLLAVLASSVSTSSSHECDNEASLPTIDDMKSIFNLERIEDGSYFNPIHVSDIEVIPKGTANLTYTLGSNVNLFLLTTEANDYGWCPDHCAEYAAAGGINVTCWDACIEEFRITYGLTYFHRLKHDETWHFYFGDTIYLYELDDNAAGDVKLTLLGSDHDNGEVTSHTIPANTWFGAQVNPGSESDAEYLYSFGATVAAPVFEDGDYELMDITYQWVGEQFLYNNMVDKITELSFENGDADDSFGHEGVNSLCHDSDEDHEEHDDLDLDEVVSHYSMEEGPIGGYSASSYTSPTTVLSDYGGDRAAMSDTYYAMNDTVFFHRQHSDETIHFYDGEPITLYEIDDTERPTVLRIVPIGSDVMTGQIPHYTVKQDNWVAFEFKNNNLTYWNEVNSTPYTFLGLTNAPGFHEEDLEFGVPESMIQNFPQFASTIISLYASAQENSEETEEVLVEDLLNTTTANCNLTNVTILDFNVSSCYNVTFNETNATYGFDFNTSISGFNSAQASVAEDKSRGIFALYVLAGMACFAVIAFVVVRIRRDDREPIPQPPEKIPDGITVVCERGGEVQNLETISVAGKSRNSVGYIDFAGMVHSNR